MPRLRFLAPEERAQRVAEVPRARLIDLPMAVAHPWFTASCLAPLLGLSADDLDRVLRYQAGFADRGGVVAVAHHEPDVLRLRFTGPVPILHRLRELDLDAIPPELGFLADGTIDPAWLLSTQLVHFAEPGPARTLYQRVASAMRTPQRTRADQCQVAADAVTALIDNGYRGRTFTEPTPGVAFADEPLAASFSDLIPTTRPPDLDLLAGRWVVSEAEAASPWWFALGFVAEPAVPYTAAADATPNGRPRRESMR